MSGRKIIRITVMYGLAMVAVFALDFDFYDPFDIGVDRIVLNHD